MNPVATAQRFGEISDLPLARAKDEHVATRTVFLSLDLIDEFRHLPLNPAVTIFNRVEVMNLNRIGAPRDLDNGRVVKVLAETLNIDCRRSDDDFEIWALRQ